MMVQDGDLEDGGDGSCFGGWIVGYRVYVGVDGAEELNFVMVEFDEEVDFAVGELSGGGGGG